MTKNGILCEINDKRLHLDPKRAFLDGVNFVSHAHSDHLPNKNGGTIISSVETRCIAKLRGFDMSNHVEELNDFALTDTGHILGSKGILFDDVFYTGDICTRDRGFLKGARIPQCKVMITECTFGLPEFVFPTLDEIKNQVNEIISSLYSKGIPVLLMGYQLGKAQTITQLFGHWEPIYFHDSIKLMNELHSQLGVSLKEGMGHSEAERQGKLEQKPWVMIAPLMSSKNSFVKHMKSKYGAVTIGFSGWAQSNRFAFSRGTDYFVPLSDHCDYNELIDMVKQSGAEKVYTVHGFAKEFANTLNKIGIEAHPLQEEKVSLENFL